MTRPRISPIVLALRRNIRAASNVALFLALWAGLQIWVAGAYERMLEAQLRLDISTAASSYSSSLANALNQRLSLVHGLAAYVNANIEVFARAETEGGAAVAMEYEVFAGGLISGSPGIRNVFIAPHGVIRYVHPLMGNAAVIGNDILKDPRPGFAEAARQAIELRTVTVLGPVPLIQGGMGMIARQAVYWNDEYWGVVGLVINVAPMLTAAGLDRLPPSLTYAVRNQSGTVFAGSAAVFLGADPVVTQIGLPDGHWELAMAPARGWRAASGEARLGFTAMFWLAGVAVAGLIAMVTSRRVQLSALVAQRTAELRDARDVAERRATALAATNAELERFAYVASHDLQEPLRMVTSYTQLLAKRYAGRLDRDADEFIGYAVEGATRMSTLLNDLQVYASIGLLPPPNDMIPAGDVLATALAEFASRIRDAGAVVEVGPLPAVRADEKRLRRLFAVLIDNALEYRAPGRRPEIRVGAERRDGAWVIWVRDNGVGIEQQYQARIFVIFQRLQGRDQHAGTGMGLAIARRIVESLGGRIWVESVPGTGSTFLFSLPGVEQEQST